jgi:hypothetical protein
MGGVLIVKQGSEYELSTICRELVANWAQRLFGFAQIFAFSLTFMSTWEGMCTYDATLVPVRLEEALTDTTIQEHVVRPL